MSLYLLSFYFVFVYKKLFLAYFQLIFSPKKKVLLMAMGFIEMVFDKQIGEEVHKMGDGSL